MSIDKRYKSHRIPIMAKQLTANERADKALTLLRKEWCGFEAAMENEWVRKWADEVDWKPINAAIDYLTEYWSQRTDRAENKDEHFLQAHANVAPFDFVRQWRALQRYRPAPVWNIGERLSRDDHKVSMWNLYYHFISQPK